MYVPIDKVSFRRFALDKLFSALISFLFELSIFYRMFRRLRHNPAKFVESFAAGASRYLMEIARTEEARFLAVIFAQTRQKNCANRDVDSYAKRIHPADNFRQPLLSQLLYKNPVFRQKPGVVYTNPLTEPSLDIRSVGTVELEPGNGLGNRILSNT